ncbi:MAG: outer membrane beta-barrel protein [Rhodoferax sp.]|uniref:outer membrane beta-barrel protein n=1 Tax=Rhodoferax sp. TaxID=50421 RepID=UPI001B6722EA|nr:outer membrane beta-barrel protein [Rhodoferax sp.]MBP9904549.1 outer membrane beta-barrel protein [Rhodoferax sp.]
MFQTSAQIFRITLIATAAAFGASAAVADPYVGIQYKRLTGERSTLDYSTSQINALFGYEFLNSGGLSHSVEYTGPISSSTGQIGKYNVETTIFSIGYKLIYNGWYGRIAYAKLDRDDRDLELTSDRAVGASLGYEYVIKPNVSLHLSYEVLRNSNLKLSGFSFGSVFRF